MTGDKPYWQQQSFWFAVVAGIAAAPSILDPILPLLPEKWRTALLGIAGVCAAIAARWARKPGAEARAALPAVRAQVDAVETKADTAIGAVDDVNGRVARVEAASEREII